MAMRMTPGLPPARPGAQPANGVDILDDDALHVLRPTSDHTRAGAVVLRLHIWALLVVSIVQLGREWVAIPMVLQGRHDVVVGVEHDRRQRRLAAAHRRHDDGLPLYRLEDCHRKAKLREARTQECGARLVRASLIRTAAHRRNAHQLAKVRQCQRLLGREVGSGERHRRPTPKLLSVTRGDAHLPKYW